MAFKEKENKNCCNKCNESKYTLEQVHTVVLLTCSGILGLGEEDFRKQIDTIPEELQRAVISGILASRETMKKIVEDFPEILKGSGVL